MLLDPDVTVAAAAVEAIGKQKYRAAVPRLIDAYYTRETREFIDVQLEVVRVLGEFRALEADTLLVQATEHPDPRVRALAVEAMTAMGRTPPELATERSFHEMDFDRTRKKVLVPRWARAAR